MTPDEIFARRSALKASANQVATGMCGYGHRWSEATVSLVESGDRGLSDAEAADLAAVLDMAPPVLAGDGRDEVRVVVTAGSGGVTVEITPEDAWTPLVSWALMQALDTVLHQ